MKVGAEDGMARADAEVEVEPKQGWTEALKKKYWEESKGLNWSDEEKKYWEESDCPLLPHAYLGRFMSPCKQGEETTTTNGDYMDAFNETRWLLKEKEMLL